MKLIYKITIIVLALVLASCTSGTGGTYHGLIPMPKFVDGEIKDGVYMSPEEAFKVKIPYSLKSDKDAYEWSYTEINELKDENVIGVVFGPAAFDRNKYHTVLIRMPIPRENKNKYITELFEKKAKSRHPLMKKTFDSSFEVNKSQSHYAVYESDVVFFVVTLVDHGDYFYLIEADVPKKYSYDYVDIDILKHRSWSRYNRLLKSFTVINGTYKT